MNEKEKAENVKMMKDPGDWPCWPLLPMINREKQKSAILLATGKPVVYLINMFELKERGFNNISDVVSAAQEQKIKTIECKNFEEIIDAGWEVD